MGEQHLPVTKGYYVPKMIHQAVLLKVAERDKRKEKKKDDDVAQAEKRIKELFPSMEEEEAKKIINRGWSVGVGAQKTLFPHRATTCLSRNSFAAANVICRPCLITAFRSAAALPK
jgi:hypothetical protein